MRNLLKTIFCILLMLPVTLSCKKAVSGNALATGVSPQLKTNTLVKVYGVNYNAGLNTADIVSGELAKTHTGDVRGIMNVLAMYYSYPGGTGLAADANIVGYKTIKPLGYKTTLSLRFYFAHQGTNGMSIPAKGSTLFNNIINFLYNNFLPEVMPSTDIIVTGNEPFVEALPADKDSDALYDFYTAVAEKVKDYKMAHSLNTPLYMGSFDDGYMTYRQTNATYNKLLLYVKNNHSWVNGADLHIHHTVNTDLNDAMDYVIPKLDISQKVIVTEFSCKKFWDLHLTDNLSTTFKTAHPHTGINTVEQYINYAVQSPVTKAEWDDFNSMNTWLESHKSYICNSYAILSSYAKFYVGFFAIRQGTPSGFQASDGGWILNGLLTTATVQNGGDGLPQGRYVYFNDFKALKDGTATSCN